MTIYTCEKCGRKYKVNLLDDKGVCVECYEELNKGKAKSKWVIA